MNGLQTLFLESILGIKLGAMNYNATEFEGHIDMMTIENLCNEGMLSWQNPEAPRSDVAYVIAHFDRGQECNISIDPRTNTIVVDLPEPEPQPRLIQSLSLSQGIQYLGRPQRQLRGV